MGRRYQAVKAEVEEGAVREIGRAEQQLRGARKTAQNPAALTDDFLDTIRLFEEIHEPNIEEGFYDGGNEGRKTLYEDPAYVGFGNAGTNLIAGNLSRPGSDGQPVGASTSPDLPDLIYLDRELVPTRSRSQEVGYDDPDGGERVRLDLLFGASRYGTALKGELAPVVAEVKALSDENVYYALIQGLNCCAQLSSTAQRDRLAETYHELSAECPMELWIVLAEHNSRGPEKAEMARLAHEIVQVFMQKDGIADHLSAIRCVDAEVNIALTDRSGSATWSVPGRIES